MATINASHEFIVLIPVKGGAEARRRLAVESMQRRVLAASFLADAITAAARARLVKEVVVLTPDPSLGGLAGLLGATWLCDQVGGGLNAAVREGVRRLADPVGHVAVMVADLPALDESELDAALGQVLDSDSGRLCVEDRAGGGTTLLAARDANTLVPRFGEGSAARHSEAGFRLADGALRGLRRLTLTHSMTCDEPRPWVPSGPSPRALFAISGCPSGWRRSTTVSRRLFRRFSPGHRHRRACDTATHPAGQHPRRYGEDRAVMAPLWADAFPLLKPPA